MSPRGKPAQIAPTIRGLRNRLEELLQEHRVTLPDYQKSAKTIRATVLQGSQVMGTPNFRATSVGDLRTMAELYDAMFFENTCLALARHYGMAFRWSSRMTKAGGKTTRFLTRRSLLTPAQPHYEITLSSSLLFQTFRDQERQIRVCGCRCVNRLEAMQRIVEHELIHLGEMLAWNDSDCSATQFQSIAYRFFSHTEHRHELVTQRERAQAVFNVRLGSKVSFRYEGKKLVGVVNRITRRATVLVESPAGVLYSDGKRYRKFYIPIAGLKPA